MANSQTHDLDSAHARIGELSGKLARRARLDIEGAVLSGADYEARVSGSSDLTATEAGVDALSRAADHQRILKTFQKAAAILYDTWAELNPQATGEQCPEWAPDADGTVVQCEGQVTHRGRCYNHHRHRRKNQPPPDANLIREWNSRGTRDCSCGGQSCPHDPGQCLNRIDPDTQARTCGTCRNRRSQDRQAG